jgi:YHS domain-containing protein
MFVSKRKFLLIAVLASVSACLPLGWQALGGSDKPASSDGEKVAIQGYDTVAYFTEGKPTPGNPEFESTWQGARWRFASAAHRDMFAKQPESYAPRFGGLCVMGLTMGVAAMSDPEAWTIVDGKLYLGSYKEDIADFKKDPAANIEKAEQVWKAVSQ